MNDNVRKVFDLLGVEPNEEFEIEDKNGFWKIDEKLNLYYRQGHYDNGDYAYNVFNNSLIIDLIKNPDLIIKIKKETKTKKLRDLTEEEFSKWQEKNCEILNDCTKCIFGKVTCQRFINSFWLNHKDIYNDKFLDQEIKVEE